MSRPSAHPIPRTGLSTEAHRRIDQAERLIDAIHALGELNLLLSETEPRRWHRARDISKRLHWFETTAYPRIRAGHRQPRDTLEKLLTRLAGCDALPRSRRKLHDLLD